MKALARGFLAGFGFALGASVAGTLIGYTIGRIGEASVKRLLSPEPTSSPAPSSSQPSSEQPDTDDELPVSTPGYLDEVDRAEHNAGYGVVPVQEQCAAHSPNNPFGDFVCSLSKGHTKPVEHWDAGRGAMFFTPPEQHHKPDYVVRPDTGDGRSLPCVTCGVTTPDASYRDGLPVCDKCYASAVPSDDEDDGSQYFRDLDGYDNAKKAEETEAAEKSERDGKQAS